MDTTIQLYMEETEDMLQKAEECIIRLESEYSCADINELFRIAHTIKGSSYMVGYEDVGNIMHKIEDMLDCARNGTILFNQSIVSLCLEGLDAVKKMLQFNEEPCSTELMERYSQEALKVSERVEGFIKANKKEEKKIATKQPEMGIVSTLLNQKPKGKNKYYVTFIIEEDVPMASPVLMLILKSIENIGSLVYSSITDHYFEENSNEGEWKIFDTIICTDVDEAELYTYFNLFYVEKVNIIDLTRSIHEANDYCFNENDITPYVIVFKAIMKIYNIVFSKPKKFNTDREEQCMIKDLHGEVINAFGKMQNKNKEKINEFIKEINETHKLIMKLYEVKIQQGGKFWANSQERMIRLIEKLYNEVRGKYIVRIFKSDRDNFMDRLKNFIEMVNRSETLILLIDISKLNILNENEIKDLIEMKKYLQDQGIEISLIAKGPSARRIINIFDSIKPLADVRVFASELEALLGMIQADDSYSRISKKIKDVGA